MEKKQKKDENTRKAASKHPRKETMLKIVDEITRGFGEEETLRKHRVTVAALDKLLSDPNLIQDVTERIGLSIIRTKLLIAQYAQTATAKLISLMDCEKEETARKACLDIIELAQKQSNTTLQKEMVSEIRESGEFPITEEQASNILATLAQGAVNQENDK